MVHTMKHSTFRLIIIFLHITILFIKPLLSIDFVFNGFDTTDISLYGNATLESRILTLTKETPFSIGRALTPQKIPTKAPNSSHFLPFYTSFIFAMAPYKHINPGHGIVFLLVPYTGTDRATSSQNLGFLNRTYLDNPESHVLGVEFDVFKNEEFEDLSDNHVGIDINSLTSEAAHEAGFYQGDSFKGLDLNNGKNYQVWVDYADSFINVTMAEAGVKRPEKPLISTSLNLSGVLEDETYVGFTAATGQLVQSHKILAWSFSNENSSLSDSLITLNLPSFELPKDPAYKSKWFVAVITVGLFLVMFAAMLTTLLVIRRNKKLNREREEMEDWETEYWPHKIPYQEIGAATKSFSDENVIGIGGNGKVYKGVFPGGEEVAVKRISQGNGEGAREFVSEISSLGRLKHRNLVGVKGWCKKERRGSFILVYEYMENGSLDKVLFGYDDERSKVLTCETRIRILKDVASALLYLHEGWESTVLHRDIKSSNVLLDKDMNAKLGDFGLARMHNHTLSSATTSVVGTIGYLAPEVVKTGRATTEADVYGFGILILEIMCCRRPIEVKPMLVDWVLEIAKRGESLVHALDEKLRSGGGYNEEEVERVMQVGLVCTHPEPSSRPTMRQVVKFFEGKTETDDEDQEDENMGSYLLSSMRSRELWSIRSSSNPTVEEIRNGLCTSSTSWSNTRVMGR